MARIQLHNFQKLRALRPHKQSAAKQWSRGGGADNYTGGKAGAKRMTPPPTLGGYSRVNWPRHSVTETPHFTILSHAKEYFPVRKTSRRCRVLTTYVANAVVVLMLRWAR